MTEPPALSFAGLLRQLRVEAGLTQEELAEAAGLSPRTVSDLERGVNRTAHKDTAGLLAGALALAGSVRGVFVAAARGQVPAVEVLAARAQALDAFAGNMPVQVSSFIGRVDELADLVTAMRRSSLGQARVVTLTGAGGVGKTRLAVHAARQVTGRFADGRWLCELAPVRDPSGVDGAVATVLSVTARAGQSIRDTLVEFLRAKQLLLVLDNCEHLLDGAAGLAENLARSCERLVILATSREGLGIDGERLVPVPPLGVPGVDADLSAITSAEAVRLFAERAAAVKPSFQVTAENAAAVAAVVRRLDGMALAVELAASRMSVMTRPNSRGGWSEVSRCSPPAAGARWHLTRRCGRRSTGHSRC